jgi:hypothetical protein
MTCNTEKSFFEDGILLVPEGETGADVLMRIAVSANTVLALRKDQNLWSDGTFHPTIDSRSGLVMGKRRPSVAIGSSQCQQKTIAGCRTNSPLEQ